MTFLEAVASGRKFRRPNNTKGFYYFFKQDGWLMCSQTKMGDMEPYECIASTGITKEDILATDWEIELVNKVVNKEILSSAIKHISGYTEEEKLHFEEQLLKELEL